jgi:threonine dehydratase
LTLSAGFGATVDLIDTTKVTRNERIAQLADQMPGAYLASAYDDQLVIDGNATLGAEIAKHKFRYRSFPRSVVEV